MSVEQTEQTMRGYLDALFRGQDFSAFFAEDVTWTTMENGELVRGRGPVRDLIVALHQQIFEATPELKSLVCGDGIAGLEAVFVGRHVGEFAGMAATGAEVRLPYTVFYEVQGGKITALRGYLSMLALADQLRLGVPAGV